MSSDSGHWYAKDGTPHHTITGKNGTERRTTLRDARKYGWLPSVSAIIGVLEKPQLTRWKMEQVARRCHKMQPDVWPEEDFVSEAIRQVNEEVSESADFGSSFHKSVENYFAGKPFDQQFAGQIETIAAYMSAYTHSWSEKCLVSPLGYAGTADWKGECSLDETILYADFKTRRTKKDEPIKRYDTNCMQLSAYAAADSIHNSIEPRVTAVNIIVSSTEPGRIEFQRWTHAELVEAYQAFKGALAVWKYTNNYYPKA